MDSAHRLGRGWKQFILRQPCPAPAPISGEESPYFDLSALSFSNETAATLADSTGMFAYPSASPIQYIGREASFQIAYLQSIFNDQSDTSRYRLVVMDRDGSNSATLFPPPDKNGLEPQTPAWAPAEVDGQTGHFSP